jgi:aspartate carbamoyltransferase catalytic subunit
MAGRRVAIVGDVKHSRVARSDMDVFVKLGAEVTVVAPSTLLPPGGLPAGIRAAHGIDEVVGSCDVLYMLRMQRERMDSALVPELGEYSARFGLDAARAARLPAHALVMHPGPMNRGVEMLVDPATLPGSRILAQVANGVAVRMAVLFTILGGAAAGLAQGDT